MKNTKQSLIEEFRKRFYDDPSLHEEDAREAGRAQYDVLEQFLSHAIDTAVAETKKETMSEFKTFVKHWIRGHKKPEWDAVYMDTIESFIENRADEFVNWEFDEHIAMTKREIDKSRLTESPEKEDVK